MPNPAERQIVRMDWDEVEAELRPTARSAKRSAEQQSLRDYFGEEEFRKLQEIASQSQAVRARREVEPPLGNIILIPGIMGSDLASIDGKNQDRVWINLFRLAVGWLGRLRLSPDGARPAKSGLMIEATGIDKRTYARAVLKLRARWNVEPFPFDWRKDLNDASDMLSRFIKEKFADQPVNLVAHSMGGLVARNFIRRHKKQWDETRNDGRQGGRLVMLGTPNYGSFTIPQVLTGVEKMVVWLSRFDLSNSLTDVLEIIDTFVGCYQMLPSPEKLPATMKGIYRREVWGGFPVSDRHLERAREFHEEMKNPATIDPERMSYIAGCNRRTLSGLEVLAPGEFRYLETLEGDGRVPHALGRLDQVRTYYVDEVHGDLAKNEQVLQATEEILQHGITSVLPEQPIASRSTVASSGRWSRTIGDYEVAAQLESMARRARDNELSVEEQRAAEEALGGAATGVERPARSMFTAQVVKKKSVLRGGKRPKLELEVVHQDVTRIAAPVVVAGQYRRVAPVNALGILDRALNNWISEGIKHSMIGGDLGQLFFIPVKQGSVKRKIRAESVLLAGMGEEGRFSEDDLRYLMLNVTYGISALEVDHYATLLIGAGAGSLSEDQALRGLLFGICDALPRLPPKKRIRKVTIVEKNRDRFERLKKKLDDIKNEDPASEFQITVTRKDSLRKTSEEPVAAPATPSEPFGSRITIERDGDIFRFSALTRQAVIPVREVEIKSFFPEQISERLMLSSNHDEQERLGRLLTTTLIPEDFEEVFELPKPLTLILDRSTASIPWEMAAFAKKGETSFLGTNLNLTRQFRTFLSPALGIAPMPEERLRVLVIADPAPEPEYQLPGARREGRAIVQVLNQIKTDFNLDIEVIDRIGDAECDPVDILSLILDGGFSVIHYAGHGVFDEKNPANGGWVFGETRILSSREIFRARRVPRLIFANACYSAVLNTGKAFTPAEMNRQLAGIVEAFFERGVQNYIGSGWPVQDELAATFATTFYENALAGQTLKIADRVKPRSGNGSSPGRQPSVSPRTLGESLAAARKEIAHDGSTWGAYHHYGQANDFLMMKRGEELEQGSGVGGQKKGKRQKAKGKRQK